MTMLPDPTGAHTEHHTNHPLPDLNLAIEHLHMSVLASEAVHTTEAVVTTTELAALLTAWELATEDTAEPTNTPQPPLQCVSCLAEQHAGARTTLNPAICIVAGMTSCQDHLVFSPTPPIPGRTPSGIILGNGN